MIASPIDPRLTGEEKALLVSREVDRVASLGIERELAIKVVAQRHGLEPGLITVALFCASLAGGGA